MDEQVVVVAALGEGGEVLAGLGEAVSKLGGLEGGDAGVPLGRGLRRALRRLCPGEKYVSYCHKIAGRWGVPWWFLELRW